MDGRIGSFSYLIEEVESDFFQKAAEEIAYEEVQAVPEIPERFQKLATLIYQSNEHGLTKQASEGIFSDMSSYENVLNRIAASAYYEPLGMTKCAFDFLTVLEEEGVDEEELIKFAEFIVEDTVGTDAVIEAAMEKEAGDSRPIEEIYDELIKEAVASFALPVMKAGRRIAQAARSVGGAVFRDRPGAGTGMFARWGKATAAEGVKKPIARVATAIPRKIRATKSRLLGKWRGGGLKARRARINELRKQMLSLRSQLRAAKPGTGQAEEIGSRIKDMNKLLAHQRQRVRSQIGKIRKGQGKAGIERVPGGAPTKTPKKTPKPTTEGAEKAREAATPPPKAPDAPTSAPPPPGAPKPKGERSKAQINTKDLPKNLDVDAPGPSGPSGPGGKGVGSVRKGPVGNVDTSEAERAAAETSKKMEGVGSSAKTRGEREAEAASRAAKQRAEEVFSGKGGVTPEPKKSPGYREKKAPDSGKAPPSGKAPGPRPPKEAVEGKGMGVMDAWSKWGREGWGGLTEVEKSRLIRAGVMAGGGLMTYKTVTG